MKKKYEPATVNVVLINATDVILTSSHKFKSVTLDVLDIDAIEVYR